MGATLLTALLFGALPALHAARADANEALRESGRGLVSPSQSSTRRGLVTAEFALSLVLLSAATWSRACGTSISRISAFVPNMCSRWRFFSRKIAMNWMAYSPLCIPKLPGSLQSLEYSESCFRTARQRQRLHPYAD